MRKESRIRIGEIEMENGFARMFVSKLLSFIGAISFIAAAIGLIIGFSKGFTGGEVFLIFFLCVAGFVLKKGAKRIYEEEDKASQYLTVILGGKVYNLTDIARTTGKPYDVVYRDVKKMIQRRQLKDAYLDEQTRQIVLVKSDPVSAKAALGKAKVLHCSSCGANNTVYGNAVKCEYCGSPLSKVDKVK